MMLDPVCAALKHRGVLRSAYEHEHFRDNLLAFSGRFPAIVSLTMAKRYRAFVRP